MAGTLSIGLVAGLLSLGIYIIYESSFQDTARLENMHQPFTGEQVAVISEKKLENSESPKQAFSNRDGNEDKNLYNTFTPKPEFELNVERPHAPEAYKIPTSEGRNDSLLPDFEIAVNMTFTQTLVFWETAACGTTHFCNQSFSVREYKKLSAVHCEVCHCDNCSTYGDCCVDQALQTNRSRTPMDCLSGTEGWSNDSKAQTFYFVNRCPEAYTAAEVRNDCESPYRAFKPASKDPPVYSRRTGLNYINSYCAQCHEDSDTLEQWTPTANCENNVDVSRIRSRQDILSLVEQSVCYISFSPAPFSAHRKCSRDTSLISECNITGQWREFDPEIQQACDNYASVIRDSHTSYRNVFCAICNGFEILGNTEIFSPQPGIANNMVPPFSKIFDLTPDDLSTEANGCPVNSIFDEIKRTCRELVCADGRIVRDHSCAPAFLTAKDLQYRLRFDLVSEEFPEEMNTTVKKVWEDFIDEMKLYETRLGALDQKFVMYACYDSFLNSDMDFKTLSSSQMLSLEFEYDIMVGKYIGQELAESYLLDTVGSRKFSHGAPGKPLLYNIYIEQSTSEDINCSKTEIELKMVNQVSVIYLTKISKCNQVELKDSEFSVDNETGTITLNSPAKKIDVSQYVVIENKTRVCAHHFKGQKSPEDQVGSLITSISMAISLVCLLLTVLLCLWSKSRHTAPGLITLMLVITLFVAQALFLAHSYVSERKWACQLLGMTLHYVWLVVFCWKNVAAFHMYAAFTHPFTHRNTSLKRLLLKYALYAFGVPAILVTCYVSFKSLLSNRESLGYKHCFLSTTLDLSLGFFAPVVLVLFGNAYFFGRAVHVMRQMSEFEKHSNLSNSSHVALYIKMSLVLGVTWVIGVLANIFDVRVLWYVFDVLNGGSGLFIFLSHVSNKHILGRLDRCLKPTKKPTEKPTLTTGSYVVEQTM